MAVDANITNLVLNVLTQEQYDAAEKNENEMYLIEGDFEADLDAHIADSVKHITAEERTAWNGKATMDEVNTAIATAITGAIEGSY